MYLDIPFRVLNHTMTKPTAMTAMTPARIPAMTGIRSTVPGPPLVMVLGCSVNATVGSAITAVGTPLASLAWAKYINLGFSKGKVS